MVDRESVVLIVEDDDGLRSILARHLRGLSYTVEEAATAEQAAAVLDAGLKPSVVLLDVNLPGDTGWDLLRGPQMATADAPAVVICTSVTVNPRRMAELGVAGYLPKPFALETLVDTLERLLNANGARAEK